MHKIRASAMIPEVKLHQDGSSDMSTKAILAAMIICSLSLVCACSQQLAVKPDGIERYETAFVSVSSTVTDGDDRVRRLTDLINTQLEQNRVYRYLNHPNPDPAAPVLQIGINIIDIHETTASRLIALGKAERSNEVRAVVTLSDRATGERLVSFRLFAESPSRHGLAVDWPWGSVDEALHRLSEKLVRQLRDWSDSSSA